MDICYILTLLISRFFRVEVSEGLLEGQVVANEYGCPFFSFKGIPYAEPPVGDLRFKAPIPKRPWQGILNATEHGPQCYTNGGHPSAVSEDCLYLNVYSPNIKPDKLIPVMFYIHGGGFVSGSGNEQQKGPKFLLRKNVVLVTFNYRLDTLGFLSLDTEDIPGNAAMKDQVTAMRWVKKNIHNFGGDPDNITVFGESAAGACVSFHLVSPMTKGLFNRAITQSGALTSWFPNAFASRDRALLLANQVGCDSRDDKEIAECLRAQDPRSLLNKKIPVSYWQYAKEGQDVFYAIVSETQFGDNERFFYGDPYDMLRNNVHEGIQVMAGFTPDDGVLFFADGIDADVVYQQANQFLEFFVPEPFTVHTPLVTQMEIGRGYRDFYLQNQTASKATMDNLLRYVGMEVFIYGVISQQKIISQNSTNRVYLYEFTCYSELNFFIYALGLQDLFDYRTFVAHADELGYLFSMFRQIDMNSNTFKMIDQVTTLWTNFAKYGDPTPDDSLGVKWQPFTVENQDYFDIGDNLVPKKYPYKEEVDFWEKNFRQHYPKYAP